MVTIASQNRVVLRTMGKAIMYKIVGADQMEHGPVTVDQLRQWIVEGRATAQTSVRKEGDSTWKPLSMFPELEASLPTTPTRPHVARSSGAVKPPTESIKSAVSEPRKALLFHLVWFLVLSGVFIGLAMEYSVNQGKDPEWLGTIVFLLMFAAGVGALITFILVLIAGSAVVLQLAGTGVRHVPLGNKEKLKKSEAEQRPAPIPPKTV